MSAPERATPTVHAMLVQGLSDRTIARRTGIDRRKIARMRRESGLAAWQPPMPAHGTDARYQRGCHCDACIEAHAVASSVEYARSSRSTSDTPADDAALARMSEHRRINMAATRAAARRSHRPWAPDDIATALDYARSATEVAYLLGRSKASVEHVRRKYKDQAAASAPLPRGRRATRRQA